MGWKDDPIVAATAAPPVQPPVPWGANDPIVSQAPREPSGLLEHIQAGFQGSAPGLAWRGRLPDLVMNPEHSKWWERAAAGFAAVGAELPLMIGGALAGAPAGAALGTAVTGPAAPAGAAVGGILGAGAGMFAVPGAIRESLIQAYSSGEIRTSADWFNIVRAVATTTAKEAAVGAATFGAGSVAARAVGKTLVPAIGQSVAVSTATKAIGVADVAAQIATMTAMPAALQGRLPDAYEFMDAAIVIGGLKAAHITAARIANVYRLTGKTPAEQVADAQAEPKIAEELRAPPEPREAPVPRGADGRIDMPTIQESLFRDQARQAELEEAAAARPLADPERAELQALKVRIADLEKQVAEAPAAPAEAAPADRQVYTPEIAERARTQAEARLAELEAKVATEPLKDAERAERVFLTNNRENAEALAKHFNIAPEIRVSITPEARDASAQRVYDDVLQQVRAADQARRDAGLEPLGDDHAMAVAALVRTRVRTRAARLGVLPEEIYRERPLQVQDATAVELAKVEAEVPPEAPRYELPEVDLFGDPVAAPVVPRLAVEGLATVEVPLANLLLSKDVPQFKAAANVEGVVVPLGGRFDRTGVGPIQVWERLDGRMEVISGRHRLDLARRSGETTIPAQIHREAEGFDVRQAATLDAQLNIREEQGSVADYAQYFRDAGITKETADELGLLARAKGRTGYAIARDASPDLLQAHRAGLLSDEAALSISAAAPGSERLQALGMAMVQEGKSHLMAINTMKAVDLMAAERMASGAQGDIFGFDDSAMREAAAMAKGASSRQRKIGEQIAAVSGASKRPEIARKMGVNVEDPEAVRAKIVELRQEQELWDNWPLHPELVAQLRAMAKPGGVTGREGELKQGPVRAPEAKDWTDAPTNEADYVTWDEISRLEHEPYVKDGVVIANSRQVPNDKTFPPVGTWRISEIKGIHGREIEQLVELPIASLKLSELDRKGRLDPAKAGDDVRYAEWLAEGRRPPPINVLQQDKGSLSVTDGHRRALAAQRAGQKTIEAWVNYAVPIPDGGRINNDPSKPFIRTGMTYEMLTGEIRNPFLDRMPFSESFELKPETPAELEARSLEAAEQAKRKMAAEAAAERAAKGLPPRVDQADLFATQGTLFQAKRLPEDLRPVAVKEYADGATAEAVAEKYGIGTSTVMRWAAYEGLARTGPETKGVTQEKREAAIKMYEEGSSIAEVSKELGLGTSTVHRLVKAEGINRNLKEVTAAPAEVRAEALRMYSDGLNSYEVAEQLGLSQSTVARWAVDADISRGWSGAQALRVVLGRNKGYGVKVPFKSSKSDGELMAPSTYELARFGQLQADENVVSFRKARDRIPYGDGRTYVPDIEVRYADGRIAVEEIKPEYLLDDATVQAKAEAAREFYAERGVEYRLVTERTIGLDGFDTIRPEKMDLPAEEQKRVRAAIATVRSYLRKVNAEESPENDNPQMTLFQQHRGSYQVAENLITIMQGADKSTVVHELTHSWLEEMKIDAQRPDAPAQLKADWEILRRELAIPESGEISRASHEQFARSGERYLGEGVAPSIELRSVFERFKQWLLEIYRDLRNLNVEINPDLRTVLDRMLATDAEIEAARELGVPRAYLPAAMAAEADRIVRPAREIKPGFKAEQIAMEPYADELPKGPGEAPDNSHVNYDTVDSATRIKLTMQRLAEIDQANIQKQRGGTAGVESWKQEQATMEKWILDTLGGGEDRLHVLRGPDGEGPRTNHRLRAMKQMMAGAGHESERMRDVILEKGHNATIEEQLQYLSSIELLRQLHAEFLGERAAVARAMNALKDTTGGSAAIKSMLDAIGREQDPNTLFQSAAEKAAADQAMLKAKLDEILQNYRGKTVLDIAKLHKEIGTLKGTFKLAKELERATTWEMVIEGWKAGLLSGPVTHTTNLFGTGAFQALRAPVDALAAIIGMARGSSPGMGETDRASMSEAVARITGMLGGVQDALKVGIATFNAGGETGKTETYRQAIPGRAGELIRIPLRLMGAEDAIVSTIYRRGELRTLAIRTAFDEGKNPSTREFAERVDYLLEHPTADMEVAADSAATRMTFNAPLGEKGVALQLFVHKWHLEWMIPFIRTPINIAKELGRMSAFAPLVGEWRADIAKGGVARDRAIAELALGSGIMALAMAYTFAGQISGAGSPDPGKNRGKVGVWQPYSRLIDDTWYEYARIQPFGTLIGMSADLATVWDHMNEEEKDKVPKMLAVAFSNAVTNQTFLQGITNFVNALSDPTRFLPRFAQQLAGSLVPNIIGQPTTMADPVVREVNSALEAIQARIPGFRQELAPKPDWLGQPVQTKERLGFVLPVRTLKVSEDKVRLEAARLDISMAAAPKKTHIGKGTGKLGDVELTPEERNTFARVGGEMAHRILGNIVMAPGYDQIPDLVKRQIFSRVLTASHKVAAVAALPPEKRLSYIQSITEKMQAELAPAGAE